MGEKYGHTQIEFFALLLTLAMGVAMLMVRRDRAIVPLLIVACLVTHAQRIVIGGLDFSMLRLIVLFGWARLLFRGETNSYRYHTLDGAMVAWQLLATIAYMLGPRASTAAFVFRLGASLDALGIYFLFRVLLRDVADIRRGVGAFSWIAIGMVLPMILEHVTRHNIFSVLGGVSEITRMRDGRLRCMASFSHPIMAGNFGATTAALVLGLWMTEPVHRMRHTIAAVSASAITILSASSGPLMAWLTALTGWGLWWQRKNMRAIRWTVFLVLLFLHLVREKPVWHLLARLASITGGTGYHRFKLIDEFIAHFSEWWLLGTGSTEHWHLAQSSDITNQYILEGIRGGLPTLLAFVTVLVLGFRTTGRSVRRAMTLAQLSPVERERTAMVGWGLGVCLAVHCVAFIGVSYFGQMSSLLYLHVAMIPSYAVALARVPAPATSPAPAPVPAAKAVREASLAPGPAPVAGTLTRRVR